MLYFLVKKGNELRVMAITPEEEVTFILLYQDQVLVESTFSQKSPDGVFALGRLMSRPRVRSFIRNYFKKKLSNVYI